MKSGLRTIVLCLVCLSAMATAQDKLVILPFGGYGVDELSAETARSLFTEEIHGLRKWSVVPHEKVKAALKDDICSTLECAMAIAEELGANHVVYVWFNKLGDKIIVQYNLFNAATKSLEYSGKMTSKNIEDLDAVMKRLAMSVFYRKPVEKTAEIGSITEYEARKPQSRSFVPSSGIGFGYLYPQSGFGKQKKVLAIDFKTHFESRSFAVTGAVGVRRGIMLNLGALYFFSPGDFAPYLGASGGIHIVNHSDGFAKRLDGFDFHVRAGIAAFRTYNFRLLLDVDYGAVFNGYRDRSVTVTVGLMKTGTFFGGFVN